MQLDLSLSVKTDRNRDEYYIGSTNLPFLVDLSKVTFLVFHPEDGGDRATLVIRPRTPKHAPGGDKHAPVAE